MACALTARITRAALTLALASHSISLPWKSQGGLMPRFCAAVLSGEAFRSDGHPTAADPRQEIEGGTGSVAPVSSCQAPLMPPSSPLSPWPRKLPAPAFRSRRARTEPCGLASLDAPQLEQIEQLEAATTVLTMANTPIKRDVVFGNTWSWKYEGGGA
eukprot:CAMPEP_0177605582 /NCGR_PEP_ID=MMETSP0419_2-20121207/16786_1 /TAXON_ID=582737 /ORGANISM="Tetraselmis sp., Strain GSL018" /LENGTH=157 /DNA_ID=CAMNT_0019099757 /DNA_START=194 /DNA_END=668 /DNA_ORIENTATION=-